MFTLLFIILLPVVLMRVMTGTIKLLPMLGMMFVTGLLLVWGLELGIWVFDNIDVSGWFVMKG